MLGDIFGGIARIAGGFIDRESARDTNNMTKDMAQQNIALQREFAQHGIQWKVEDAKRAGIHPIYALGSAGASFSPVSANFTSPPSVAADMAAVGQDVGRAVNATRTKEQRVDAFTAATQKLALERASLENENLRADLASKAGRLRQATNPPFPAASDPYLIPGQTESGLVKPKPLEVTPAPKNAPHAEGGAIVDVGYARTPTGWVPVPSSDVKNRIEDNFPQEWSHFIRNNIFPMVPGAGTPPPFSPGEGKVWRYNPLKLEWQQVTDRTHYLKNLGRAVGRVFSRSRQ